MNRLIIPGLAVFFLTASLMADTPQTGYPESYLDEMAIEIPPGSDRPYIYSGYGDAFFYGTMAGDATDGHLGFYWGPYKLWRDFSVVIDGKPLDRSRAAVSFKPHEIVFSWHSQHADIVLEVLPLYQDKNYLRFKLTGTRPASSVAFYLLFNRPERERIYGPNTALVHSIQTGCDSLWFGIAETPRQKADHRQTLAEPEYNLASLGYGDFDIAFIYASSEEEFQQEWLRISSDLDAGTGDREQWLLEEINRSYFHCQDERINQALNWTKISLAQLWAENETALWAGLPWFNDCWGRDTFISLPGACLVQGKFKQARALLERFARWQCRDPDDPNYGRIPNRARYGDISYNTADGTPWFVLGIYNYGLYSGDTGLWKDYLSEGGAVWCANEGSLKYHTDSLGFLTHGDAETWMDAVGPDGPWTPRGNRAVEIQALYDAQLIRSFHTGYMVDDREFIQRMGPTWLIKWQTAAIKLFHNFAGYFVRSDGMGLYDHLNPDGTPDGQIRPNQLFLLTICPAMLAYTGDVEGSKAKALATVRQNLAYPYGIPSLSPTDPDFHPYHQYPLYPKDAAYHNGVVWTWLSGPFKTATKGGWLLAKSEINQILDLGAPGTLSELLDAIPQEGDTLPRPSGTVSQTWSLAEFIRTWYQDYIGINPAVGNREDIRRNRHILQPRIPKNWGRFEVLLNLQQDKVLLKVDVKEDSVRFAFMPLREPINPPTVYLFRRDMTGGYNLELTLNTAQPAQLSFAREGDFVSYETDSGEEGQYQLFQTDETLDDYVKPILPKNLKALQPPGHHLLTGPEIKAENPGAELIVDLTDPAGDDVGDGGYVYPTEPNFQPGILDLTRFQMKADESNVYFKLNFRNLGQPGWHPEYGFQLTFATIAIRTGIPDEIIRRQVGRNSGWTLPEEYAADRFIHVGGGILVEDGQAKKLCQYIPVDPIYAFGDVHDKEMSFALPREFLPGDPKQWKFTVLIGAQDDHGGAGLGEFRQVAEEAEMWKGGGGGRGEPNVYDHLIYPAQ